MTGLPDDARRVVAAQRLGFVATVNDDGTPNLSPKGTVTVLDGEHLVFADIRSPRTVANLRQRPAVEINVVDPIGRKGWRFRGTAAVFDGGPRFEELVAFYRARGTTSPIETVVVVQVAHATPVLSPSYDQGLTEAELRARWREHVAALENGAPERGG